MATQFYLITDPERDNRIKENSIGRAINAGYWCWSCGEKVSVSSKAILGSCSFRHSRDLSQGERTQKPKGIAPAQAFTWHQHPYDVETMCRNNMDVPIIVSELSQPFTGREFLQYLSYYVILYYMHDLDALNV